MRLIITIDLEALAVQTDTTIDMVLAKVAHELEPATFRRGAFQTLTANDGITCVGEWGIE